MQTFERPVSSVPVSSVPLRTGTEGTDGRGSKSPLPIHSFQGFRERMGTDGNGRNGWGRFLVVEVKAQAGRLRPEQTLFLERIRAAGGVAFVARDCRDVLREIGTP